LTAAPVLVLVISWKFFVVSCFKTTCKLLTLEPSLISKKAILPLLRSVLTQPIISTLFFIAFLFNISRIINADTIS
jgi:hypothetical protein